MNYHNITKDDMLNGDGLRAVLWVAGCSHHCGGCQNPITWDPAGGLPFDIYAKAELFSDLYPDYISGVTFSGGDPLYPGNAGEVLELAEEIKRKIPGKTVWLYTGYLWEEVKDLPGIEAVDVLIDGEFIEELADIQYPWAGSTNQRVINVVESLKRGEVVLHEPGRKTEVREGRKEN